MWVNAFGSSLFVPGQPGLVAHFRVSNIVGNLGPSSPSEYGVF
jgi:hypothetical protein